MIAKDYQEVYEAVSAMFQNLFLQGVRGVATFRDVTRDAESFALSIQTTCDHERIEELDKGESGKSRDISDHVRSDSCRIRCHSQKARCRNDRHFPGYARFQRGSPFCSEGETSATRRFQRCIFIVPERRLSTTTHR